MTGPSYSAEYGSNIMLFNYMSGVKIECSIYRSVPVQRESASRHH